MCGSAAPGSEIAARTPYPILEAVHRRAWLDDAPYVPTGDIQLDREAVLDRELSARDPDERLLRALAGGQLQQAETLLADADLGRVTTNLYRIELLLDDQAFAWAVAAAERAPSDAYTIQQLRWMRIGRALRQSDLQLVRALLRQHGKALQSQVAAWQRPTDCPESDRYDILPSRLLELLELGKAEAVPRPPPTEPLTAPPHMLCVIAGAHVMAWPDRVNLAVGLGDLDAAIDAALHEDLMAGVRRVDLRLADLLVARYGEAAVRAELERGRESLIRTRPTAAGLVAWTTLFDRTLRLPTIRKGEWVVTLEGNPPKEVERPRSLQAHELPGELREDRLFPILTEVLDASR